MSQPRGRHGAAHGRGIGPGEPAEPVEPVDPDADTDFIPRLTADAPAWSHLQTPPTGLRKFDLGSIPASVTPPRSWRRAAIFAVITSSGVVFGLLVAAVALVGPPRGSDQIEALPGYPTQPYPITDLPNASGGRPPTTTSTSPSAVAATTTTATTTTTHADRSHPPPRPAEPAGTAWRTAPDGPAPEHPTPASGATSGGPGSPPRTTLPAAAARPPKVDPDTLGDRTEVYFQQVIENPEAALAMTIGPLRSQGKAGIQERYGDVERIEIEQITIDPNSSTTCSTLRLAKKNGTVITKERLLTFSHGSDPKISWDSSA